MLRFENALSVIKMIKDQIQCRAQSLLHFHHTEYKQKSKMLVHNFLLLGTFFNQLTPINDNKKNKMIKES